MAREAQREFLLRTRRVSELQAPVHAPVATTQHGFVTRIDIEAIEAATKRAAAAVEVVLQAQVGTYVVYGQVLAVVKAQTGSDAETVGKALEHAIRRQDKRDLAADPLDGVEELETIGWTSISTAQSDADSGVLTIYALRDLLARWCQPQPDSGNRQAAPVVYVDDVVPRVLNAFESLLVSASESMQHQSCAEILATFEIVFARLGPQEQRHVEDIVLRSLAALGDHVLTSELERAIGRLAAVLEKAGRRDSAKALRAATKTLARSIGKLNSRATRVP